MMSFETAACRDLDPALFTPAQDDGEGIAHARAICAGCPVRLDCLALALATPDCSGIWGGLTRHEREIYARAGTRRVIRREPTPARAPGSPRARRVDAATG